MVVSNETGRRVRISALWSSPISVLAVLLAITACDSVRQADNETPQHPEQEFSDAPPVGIKLSNPAAFGGIETVRHPVRLRGNRYDELLQEVPEYLLGMQLLKLTAEETTAIEIYVPVGQTVYVLVPAADGQRHDFLTDRGWSLEGEVTARLGTSGPRPLGKICIFSKTSTQASTFALPEIEGWLNVVAPRLTKE